MGVVVSRFPRNKKVVIQRVNFFVLDFKGCSEGCSAPELPVVAICVQGDIKNLAALCAVGEIDVAVVAVCTLNELAVYEKNKLLCAVVP